METEDTGIEGNVSLSSPEGEELVASYGVRILLRRGVDETGLEALTLREIQSEVQKALEARGYKVATRAERLDK